MSTLAKVLIAIGVVAVLGFGACVGAGFFLVNKAGDMVHDLADGGGKTLVLVSPPEVKAALAGPKAAYVGAWKGAGENSLTIDQDGAIAFSKNSGGSNSNMNAAIAAFRGDNIELKAFVTVTLKVSEPPHKVGDHWEITVDGVKMQHN